MKRRIITGRDLTAPDWLVHLPNFAGAIYWPSLTFGQLQVIQLTRPALRDSARREIDRRLHDGTRS